jgi:hypothetical protein
VVALAAAACAGQGSGPAGLGGVDVDAEQNTIVLITGCYDRAGGDAELRDGQIVVTDLWGEGRRDGADCARGVPIDLQPGPDVVDPEGERRYALVGGCAVPDGREG